MADGCSGQGLKVVVVGDEGCGKTSLQIAFAQGIFPETYVPTVAEIFPTHFRCGSQLLEINLWDTAGQQDYDRLRPLCYTGANVVMICYDISNPVSFENVLSRWLPEVSHFCVGTPTFLVGCKKDLRMNKICLRNLQKTGQEPITYTQGQTMARRIRAAGFLECSAKLQETVVETFREATLATISGCRRRRRRRKARGTCVLS